MMRDAQWYAVALGERLSRGCLVNGRGPAEGYSTTANRSRWRVRSQNPSDLSSMVARAASEDGNGWPCASKKRWNPCKAGNLSQPQGVVNTPETDFVHFFTKSFARSQAVLDELFAGFVRGQRRHGSARPHPAIYTFRHPQ
jgi:hypothetical protein